MRLDQLLMFVAPRLEENMSNHGIPALVFGIVALVIMTSASLTFGVKPAHAEPMCQDNPAVVGTIGVPGSRAVRCGEWQCARRGQCLVQVGWKKVPIETYTPGTQEYENQADLRLTNGCLRWTCVGAVLRPCEPGYLRIGARCVPGGSHRTYVR